MSKPIPEHVVTTLLPHGGPALLANRSQTPKRGLSVNAHTGQFATLQNRSFLRLRRDVNRVANAVCVGGAMGNVLDPGNLPQVVHPGAPRLRRTEQRYGMRGTTSGCLRTAGSPCGPRAPY